MQRAKTWTISSTDEFSGLATIKPYDQIVLQALLKLAQDELATRRAKKGGKQPKVTSLFSATPRTAGRLSKANNKHGSAASASASAPMPAPAPASGVTTGTANSKPKPVSGRFSTFTRLCEAVADVSSTTDKIAILRKRFAKFDGDLVVRGAVR